MQHTEATDDAIIDALKNIINCKNFTEKSIRNFYNNHIESYRILTQMFAADSEKSTNAWTTEINTYVIESKQKPLLDLAKEAFTKAAYAVSETVRSQWGIDAAEAPLNTSQSSANTGDTASNTPLSASTPSKDTTKQAQPAVASVTTSTITVTATTVTNTTGTTMTSTATTPSSTMPTSTRVSAPTPTVIDIQPTPTTPVHTNGSGVNTQTLQELQQRLLIEALTNLSISVRNNNIHIETLKGEHQNIKMWFERFEIQTNSWSNSERGTYIPVLFEGRAIRLWQMMAETDKYDYYKIKSYLMDNFKPSDSQIDIKVKFYSIKQELSESIDDFSQRLHAIKHIWPQSEISTFEREITGVFVNGLLPEIKKHVLLHSQGDLKTVIKNAKAIEQINKTEIENHVIAEVSAPIATKQEIKCYSCNQTGHMANECPQKRTKNACIICDKSNHTTAKCRLLEQLKQNRRNKNSSYNGYKSNKTNFQNKNNENNNNDKNTSKTSCKICKKDNHDTRKCRFLSDHCFNCGKRGHKQTECRSLNQ